MGFRFVLILTLSLLLAGCAQVGTLTGGDKDYFAPAPIEMLPPQKSTGFNGKEVEIRFNEFVELVNPQQNVFFVPNDAKPEVRLSNKTLHVSWKEELKPNTTYSIYLNGVVRDITEGNDSLMTYVFSTGDHIDSLYYQTRVVDAWTNEPVKNALVGLFTDSDTLKPLYFSRSDIGGEVTLSNLKEGEYSVKVYMDEDRNLLLNRNETRGFREGPLKLDSSFVDSSSIRIYTPQESAPSVISHKFLAPGVFQIETSTIIEDEVFVHVNDTKIPSGDIVTSGKKLLFSTDVDTLTNAQIKLSGALNDTLSVFLSGRDKSTKCQLKAVSSIVGPLTDIAFELNDKIISIDTNLISVMNMQDSSTLENVSFSLSNNFIHADLNRKGLKNLMFIFQKGSISTLNQEEHVAYMIPIEAKAEKEFGTLVITGWDSDVHLLVQIKGATGDPYLIPLTNSSPVKVNAFLTPGEYNVRVIEDVNKNNRWDSGNIELTVQPEKIHDFNPVKIRANWEVELTLDPTENE